MERKIRSVYHELFPNGIPMHALRPASFDPFIADKAERGATQDSLRHLYQQVSMISNMQEKYVIIFSLHSSSEISSMRTLYSLSLEPVEACSVSESTSV